MHSKNLLSIIFTIVLTLTLGLICKPLFAQIPDTLTHSRFQFAQTYIGMDLYNQSGTGSIPQLGAQRTIQPNYRVSPRINIGGPHFWGHADFFVNVPVFNATPEGKKTDVRIDPGIETGFRLYPWSMYQQSLTPFAGFSWSAFGYQQDTDAGSGPSKELSTTYLQGGLAWQTNNSLIQLGLQYQTNSTLSYPLSRNQFEQADLNSLQGWISYKYLFDTTNNPDKSSADYKREHNINHSNAFSLGAGLSSAFGLQNSSYNQKTRPFLDDPTPSSLSPDISLGYHFFDLQASLRISYRRIIQSQQAFGLEQRFTRNSFSFEAIKFLGDYHGFVPFTGLFTGPEFITATENDRGEEALNIDQNKWGWGFSVGWDIRPTADTPIVLRTNLRYAPTLSLTTPNGQTLQFDHLEVDFIQVVVYPQRLINN